MKKIKNLKSKIIMFILALVLPLSASALIYTFDSTSVANADSVESSKNYSTGYTKEITLSNSNFSNVSTYSISTSLTGWQGLNNDKKTTAGIINVGNSFQTYMTSTYKLSNNPKAKATDKNILMINSKTSTEADYDVYKTARQGYKSNSVTLEANSYYSFQVSFKADTNYKEVKQYIDSELTLSGDKYINYKTFENAKFDEYIGYQENTTKYVQKKLSNDGTMSEEYVAESSKIFYEDDEYIGFIYSDNKPYYVAKSNVSNSTENEKNKVIANGAEKFVCNFEFDVNSTGTSKRYKIASGTPYFKEKITYDAVDNTVFGSMYLSGLKDKDGNKVKAEYVKVTSKEWETFYFFVATGDQSQSVTLDLWLGSNNSGLESSGVVFYDDVHVYKYSENSFWKTYQNYYGRGYNLSYKDDTTSKTEKVNCVTLTNLKQSNAIELPSNNFNFEEGAQSELNTLKNWKALGNKNARVFNAKDPTTFKNITGYDFVGTTLTASANYDEAEDKIVVDTNDYVLALWAKENYSAVKSNPIQIKANEVYKITAYYKISDLTNGKVYTILEENEGVADAYNAPSYKITAKKESTGVTENGSSDYNNKYGKIEYYVKGGNYFDTSVSLTLSLGTESDPASGCVLFDDITVEKAKSDDFDSAANKYEIDARTESSTIPNAYFNKVKTAENGIMTPQNWTITNNGGIAFGGVIDTETSKYNYYKEQYKEYAKTLTDAQNPYYWALNANPGNAKGNSTDKNPDKVLMLANFSSNASQKVVSDTFTLSVKEYRLSFGFKTTSSNKVTMRIHGNNNVLLFEKQITSNGAWRNDYSVYLKPFMAKETVSIEFEVEGNGTAYFDNFELEETADGEFATKFENPNENAYGVVNMDNFYANLPTNNITNDLKTSTSPAWEKKLVSGDADSDGNIGAVVKGSYPSGNLKLESEDADKNILYFTNQTAGTYSLQSNFNFDLSSETKYYKLTFKAKTHFAYQDGEKLDSKKTYSNGFSVGLTGFDYMTKIVSNDEYTPYNIYFMTSSDVTAKLYVAFISDAQETAGAGCIYDLALTTVDEDTYNKAVEDAKDDESIFISKASDSTDDDNNNDDNNKDNTDTTTSDDMVWLYVPTIITALAIVIAIIGFALKNVKVKKIEKVKKSSYDRKSSLDIDRIKRLAKVQRDAQVKDIQTEIDKFAKELVKLEKEHKTKVVELRAKDGGKVSKATDREFKHYAQKCSVINEKIDNLNKQIDNLNSAEYLLSLERKLYAEEDAKRRELEKMSKKLKK